MAHLLEVATGIRGGDPLRPGSGEPQPEYDPATTTLDQPPPGQGGRTAALDREKAQAAGPERGQLPDPDPVGGRPAPVRPDRLRGRPLAAGKAAAIPSITGEVREAIFTVPRRPCGGRK